MVFAQVGEEKLRTLEILIFIFALGVLCLSWPILEIFRAELIGYLFIFWFAYILLVAYIDHNGNRYKKS